MTAMVLFVNHPGESMKRITPHFLRVIIFIAVTPSINAWAEDTASLHQTEIISAPSPEDTKLIANYECKREKIVGLNSKTKDFMPPYDPDDEALPEYNFPEFTVKVIRLEPNSRCPDYYKDHPLSFWMQCQAKYAIAFDGYKGQARSTDLRDMRSDDGHRFYGPFGLFSIGTQGYFAEYDDDGGSHNMEIGTCQKK